MRFKPLETEFCSGLWSLLVGLSRDTGIALAWSSCATSACCGPLDAAPEFSPRIAFANDFCCQRDCTGTVVDVFFGFCQLAICFETTTEILDPVQFYFLQSSPISKKDED
jgi:hypothetical protein